MDCKYCNSGKYKTQTNFTSKHWGGGVPGVPPKSAPESYFPYLSFP